MSKANEALDKKAENARELGLDYEPVAKHYVDGGHLVYPTAQRQSARSAWVGQTDEEIVTMSRYDLQYAALIGEVERKLKEKNSD